MDIPKGFKPGRNLDDEVERLKEGYRIKGDQEFFKGVDRNRIPASVVLVAEKDKHIYSVTYGITYKPELSSDLYVNTLVRDEKFFSLNFSMLVTKIVVYHCINDARDYHLESIDEKQGVIHQAMRFSEPPLKLRDIELAIYNFYKKTFDNIGVVSFRMMG